MAKITRPDSDVGAFAENSTSTNRTVFGDTTQSDTLDDNLNSDFLTGWEIVPSGRKPTIQDFNAAFYTISKMIAYLFQTGIPEWNTNQEYHIGGFSQISGVAYISQTNNNSGNSPATDTTNWKSLINYIIDNFTSASTTTAGKVRLSTDGETQTGVLATVAATPKSVQAKASTDTATRQGALTTLFVTPASLQSKNADSSEAKAMTSELRIITPKNLSDLIGAWGSPVATWNTTHQWVPYSGILNYPFNYRLVNGGREIQFIGRITSPASTLYYMLYWSTKLYSGIDDDRSIYIPSLTTNADGTIGSLRLYYRSADGMTYIEAENIDASTAYDFNCRIPLDLPSI